jgi:hypothetical protein
MSTKKPKMLQRLSVKLKQFIKIPLKTPVDEVKSMVESLESTTKEPFKGALDEFGREIVDPRPVVVEVRPLTQEQKIWNQFAIAQQKAAIEYENLPWDLSTPEKVKEVMKELLNFDMPEDEMEFVSQYETIGMAEDYNPIEAKMDTPPPQDPAPATKDGPAEGETLEPAPQS